MQSVTMPRAKQPASAVRAALTLIGFSAVIGQIVLMRELIVVFNGNEISLGIMFATWLFWTAAGSGLSSGFALGGNNARRAVAAHGICRVGDMLEFVEDKTGNDQGAVDKARLADIGDAPVDDSAGV
jgi:hypothetical protein